jgi:hypothetical protein
MQGYPFDVLASLRRADASARASSTRRGGARDLAALVTALVVALILLGVAGNVVSALMAADARYGGDPIGAIADRP